MLQAVGFYADNHIDIGLSIATINTVKRTDPSYLNNHQFDDQEYISAFIDLIDWILQTIPSHVKVDYISLGNEIDHVLKGEEWANFKIFMEEASTHIHTRSPVLDVVNINNVM